MAFLIDTCQSVVNLTLLLWLVYSGDVVNIGATWFRIDRVKSIQQCQYLDLSTPTDEFFFRETAYYSAAFNSWLASTTWDDPIWIQSNKLFFFTSMFVWAQWPSQNQAHLMNLTASDVTSKQNLISFNLVTYSCIAQCQYYLLFFF